MDVRYSLPDLKITNSIMSEYPGTGSGSIDLKLAESSGCLKRSTFLIEGLPTGKALTLGNTLRRNLLHFIPGMAPVAIKIIGADHEYSPISGLVNDSNDLAMKIKDLKVAMVSESDPDTMPAAAVLEVNGVFSNQPITFGDFVKANYEGYNTEEFSYTVLNPNEVLTYVGEEEAHVHIQVLFKRGVGYSGYNVVNKDEDINTFFKDGCIKVDSLFSPIVDANFTVYKQTPTKTSESLAITVETDGSILPAEAILQAVEIDIADNNMLNNLFESLATNRSQAIGVHEYYTNTVRTKKELIQEFNDTEYEKPNEVNDASGIEVLKLPTDLYDILKDKNHDTILDLKKNWKSLDRRDEIKKYLTEANIKVEDIDEQIYK